MTLQHIHPTSEIWTRRTAGMQWFAAYRVDVHGGQFVAVLSRWTDAIADPGQTMLRPQPTREQAAWAVEQFLAAMGYQQEGAL